MGPQGLGQQLRTLAAPEGIQVWLAVLHSGLQPPVIPVPGDPCLDLGLSRHQAYMQYTCIYTGKCLYTSNKF